MERVKHFLLHRNAIIDRTYFGQFDIEGSLSIVRSIKNHYSCGCDHYVRTYMVVRPGDHT